MVGASRRRDVVLVLSVCRVEVCVACFLMFVLWGVVLVECAFRFLVVAWLSRALCVFVV